MEWDGVTKFACIKFLHCLFNELSNTSGTANYHPGKKSGDLTDAGEVAIMLLEYLTSHREYSFDGYATYWKNQIDEGYGSCNFQTVPQGESINIALMVGGKSMNISW